jgi:NAD(P)H-hydrate epimerase
MVLDADALNILGRHKEWLSNLKPGTILTPHPKEFERLAGKSGSGYDRLMMQISFSEKYQCVVVLKGAHTSVTLPDGNVYFNSTGNPGMATAGSGDVLTGIILSLLAQGYRPADAAVAGVFIHGMAGDIALRKLSPESIIATDITENISNVFLELKDKKVN